MSKVIVTKDKLDVLANAIANKSGEPLTLTLDEMVEAVDGIEQGIFPTGNIDITHVGQTDVTNYATATVEQAAYNYSGTAGEFKTISGVRYWDAKGVINYNDGGWVEGTVYTTEGRYPVVQATTITPSTSSQTVGGIEHMMEGAVTVNAVPTATVQDDSADWTFETIDGVRKCKITSSLNFSAGYVNNGWVDGNGRYIDAVPANWTVTPTESSQIVGGSSMMMEGAVTVSAIPSNYVGSGITQRSSSDLTVSGDTVTAPAGYYSSSASKAVANMTLPTQTSSVRTGTNMATIGRDTSDRYINIPVGYNNAQRCYTISAVANGTAGTPTATKGTVTNHSVSVTPSVTNTTGYITGSTKTGTAVSVSASELVSGSETKTANGTYDVTNLAEIVVDVQGGGSSLNVAMGTPMSGANASVTFEVLAEPTSFSVINGQDISIGTDPIVSAIAYDGTNYVGQAVTNTSNAQASYISTGFGHSYDGSNVSHKYLTVSSTNANFEYYGNYTLIYTYGGGAVDTKDVQVGSGATSITFTGLEDEPAYWSLVFKSNFGTSSGYQRVIAITEYDSILGGLCLDSSAHASNQYWTSSYSNGSLTITSQGTNEGGYFHQPGYYQLTYAYDASGNYQTKSVTYTPSTSQQTQTITADSGYDALKKVNVTVNAMSSMTLPSSTSATSSGTSKATITPTSSTQYLNIPTGYNATAQYYTISAASGGSTTIKTTTVSNTSNTATSISFTQLSGTPKAFFVRCTTTLSRSSSNRYYYVADMRWDGSSTGGVAGNRYYVYNGQYSNVTSGYSYSYSNGTLTVSSSGGQSTSPGSFYNGTYELVYVY